MNNSTSDFLNEYIDYGGGAFRRWEVYKHLLKCGACIKSASLAAFSKDRIDDSELEYHMKLRETMLSDEPDMLDSANEG